MDAYRLDMLDPRLFEHLVQSLALGEISTSVIPFGDGPDGGREATFTGPTHYGTPAWDGHGIIQAKYKIRPQDPARDARWLRTELKKELEKYTREDDPLPVPDYLILATNVNLSATKDGGKDSVLAILRDFARKYGLKDADLWDYDKLGRILERNPEVRKTYLAWILPSDVLYELFNLFGSRKRDRYQIMLAYLQRELLADQYAMLEQAGHSSDTPISLAQVFVDLPTDARPSRNQTFFDGQDPAARSGQARDYGGGHGVTAESRFVGRVIAESGVPLRGSETGERGGGRSGELPGRGRYVLIGGPGQGKTTVGQYICQLFRSALLEGVEASKLDSRVPPVINDITKQWAEDGGPLLSARRLPFRIVLNQFAKSLASGETNSVLGYLALQLCKGSAKTLSPEDVDAILTEYPSIIVLDGLDEVPAVTNRDEVMEAVSNFSIEIATGELDVFLIATTRPQGYNDEFSPEQYSHHHLKPLSISDALGYGRKLAQNRFGASEERFQKVYDRLQRAAQNPATAKLMESPLQITILTLLVDRLGDPPDERWDLFSKYYDLIFARETERDIPTVKVLREHPSFVHAIHRRVGIALQVQSERSGRTNARLTEDQFRKLVTDYLSEEGYSGDRSAALAQQIIDAAAFRLVFLVGLEIDQVGFEIRSLQEFMAAEAIIDGPELQIQSRLRVIAPLDHWRNVFLFAAGKIFAERQHLRDTIRVICADLNEAGNDRAAALLMVGSDLALDLLEDGPPRKSPIHNKGLARLAVQTLEFDPRDSPFRDDEILFLARRIAALCDEDTRPIFADYLRRQLLSLRNTGENVWSFLAILTDSFGGEFQLIAQQAVELGLLNERSALQSVARSTDGSNEWLRACLARSIGSNGTDFIIPVSLEYRRNEPPMVPAPWNRDDFPGWLKWYAGYCGGISRVGRLDWPNIRARGIDFDFSLAKLADCMGGELEPPADLPLNPEWNLIRAAAEFCRAPSKDTLADALDSVPSDISDSEFSFVIGQYPWPLVETLLASLDNPHVGIADEVRRGTYGNFADWRETEEMLEGIIALDEIANDSALIDTQDGGIFRIPYRAMFTVYGTRAKEEFIPAIVPMFASSENPFIRSLLGRVILNPAPDEESVPEAAHAIRKEVRDWFTERDYLPPLILRFVDLADIDDPAWVHSLDAKIAVRGSRKAEKPLSSSVFDRIVHTIKNDPFHERGLLILLAASLLNGSPRDSLDFPVIPQPTDSGPTRAAAATIALLAGSRVSEIADQIGQFRGDERLAEQLFDAIELQELPQAEECAEYLDLATALDLSEPLLGSYLRRNHLRRSSPLIDTVGWTQLGYPATVPAVLAQQTA